MMDAPGGARDPRFNLGYNMGLLSGEAPGDMYGVPGASLGRASQGVPGSRGGQLQGCGLSRGLKRPGEPCYEERPPGMGLEHCNVGELADDGYTSLQPKKSPPSNGKKTKGRVKIKMEYIDNKLRRYTTFSKRKTGIMKKAYELSTLTGTQVMLLVASETGHVYTFATRKLQPMITSDSGKRLIQTCLNSPDPPSGAPVGDQRMSATGFEETELTYNIADDDIKDERSPMSSGESCDDSGSDDDSPSTRAPEPASSPQRDCEIRDQINTSSSEQGFGMSGVGVSGLNPGLGLPTMLCRPNMQMGGPGMEGLPPNLALGNLTMGYPHGVIIGLANQMAEGSSSSQPQFITIPLSMAMAAAGEAAAAGLQDLSRAQTLTASSLQDFSRAQTMNTANQKDSKPHTLTFAGLQDLSRAQSMTISGLQDFSRSQAVTLAGLQDLSRTHTMTVSGLQDLSRSQSSGSGNLQDLSRAQANVTGLQDLSTSGTGSSGGGRK